MNKNFGIYVGMVIQNNDPERRGRVKVFIPHMSANVYDGWNNSEDDQKFTTPSDDISQIMPRLKAILPWSEAAMPILSTGTSYIYNPSTDEVEKERNDYVSKPYSRTDQWNNDYSDNAFDETTRGTYNIPDVGAKVLVFFREGNPLYPIYFSQIYTKDDWNGVFLNNEYPNGYSNDNNTTEKHQQKLFINRRGGLFEIVDSDGYEKVRIQHKNGTYTSFTNNGYNIFTPENYNALIFKDYYSTIRGNGNSRIYEDFSEQINKNYTEIVGETLNIAESYTQLESGISIPTSIYIQEVSIALNESFTSLSALSLSSSAGKKKETHNFSWDVTVGSGGINFATTGKFNLISPYQKFSSEYLEIVSNKGIKIQSNNYTHIISPKLILEGKIYTSNSLDVKNNIKSGGAIGIGGELFVPHITAPLSFQVTESTKIKAPPTKWSIVGATLTADQGINTNVVITGGVLTIDEPHTHYFANIPLTLVDNKTKLFETINSIIDDQSFSAYPIIDGKSTSSKKESGYNGP